MKWPFLDAPNTAVVTSVDVLERGAPILQVSHHAEDGAWEFQGPGGAPSREDDLRVIALDEAIELDATLLELARLPLGWHAFRPSPEAAWKLSPREA